VGVGPILAISEERAMRLQPAMTGTWDYILSGFLGGALKVCFSLRSWPLNIIYYNSTENPRI
jgi:hypothetical protein